MADLIIKDMEMPENCLSCRFTYGESFCDTDLGVSCYCMASNESKLATRPSRCPLVPLPEKHGRLIDAEAFVDYMQNRYDNNEITNGDWIDFRLSLKDQPTIVPAEGGTDECSEN